MKIEMNHKGEIKRHEEESAAVEEEGFMEVSFKDEEE